MTNKTNQGRPTKYLKKYDKQAEKLCKLGATNEKIAEFFEVATSTVSKWIAEISSFSDAIKKGRDVADMEVAESLYKRAIGYSHREDKVQWVEIGHVKDVQGRYQKVGKWETIRLKKHYPPDTAAAFIWLKNRRPESWREKPDPGDGEQTAQPVSVTIVVEDASKPQYQSNSE